MTEVELTKFCWDCLERACGLQVVADVEQQYNISRKRATTGRPFSSTGNTFRRNRISPASSSSSLTAVPPATPPVPAQTEPSVSSNGKTPPGSTRKNAGWKNSGPRVASISNLGVRSSTPTTPSNSSQASSPMFPVSMPSSPYYYQSSDVLPLPPALSPPGRGYTAAMGILPPQEFFGPNTIVGRLPFALPLPNPPGPPYLTENAGGDLAQTQSFANVPCYLFKSGFCRYGDQCRYMHAF